MKRIYTFLLVFSIGLAIGAPATALPDRPNLLWIVVEDASPHVNPYGHTTIRTPNLNKLAQNGVTFRQASVTAPVCSPARSAMVTGMYQTTLGAHHHRSQRKNGKGSGNKAYYESFKLPVESVPELFRDAGYHVTNSGRGNGKTDYNFIPQDLYHSGNRNDRDEGQPFFAQIQLTGGKCRGSGVGNPGTSRAINVPPYYPDHPVIRKDWANYLDCWTNTDNRVGQIISNLRDEGVLQDTVVFFFTDHGISHVRGKQFLYEEGTRIPLIVRFGDERRAGTARRDLVEHIDIAVTSLALAGIEIPDYMQGRNLFGDDYRPRKVAFAARDRADETVDIIRSVKSERFKYIRNFMSYVPHAQPNRYKDHKDIVQTMRSLFRKGKLNALQSSMFDAPRPTEELYDLRADPHETNNLADDPAYAETLKRMRRTLYDRMVQTRDLGLIPEPILENLGKKHGNKYYILQSDKNDGLVDRLIGTIEAGENGKNEKLQDRLESDRPSVRYWAATWLGVNEDRSAVDTLKSHTEDASTAVRIAAALSLCKMGYEKKYVPFLAKYLKADNLITGMYAARALEQVGSASRQVLPVIKDARDSRYEYTRRIARRLTEKLE